MVTFRYYPNPFESERFIYQIEFDKLDTFLPRARGESLTYFCQGRGVITWNDICDGDIITVTPQIQSRNTAKKVLVPDGWMRWALAALTFGTSELWRPINKMILNALWPRPPKFNNEKESPTYNWEGVKTSAQVGMPIPILYGKHALGGNIIGSYTREYNNRAELNILLALCEGPITSIAGIMADTNNADLAVIGDKLKINDIPASDLAGYLTVGIRLGDDVQTPLPGFTVLREEVLTNNNAPLQQNVDRIFRTRNTDVTGISIQFLHDGLIDYNRDGSPNNYSYKADIFYKLAGNASYTYHGQYVKNGKTESPLRGQYDILGLTAGQYDIKIVQKARNTERQERITTTRVQTVIEERDFALSYPGTALVSLKIIASEILGGNVNNFNVVCEGREVLQVDSLNGTPFRAYSQNPIWIMADAIYDPIYGLGDSIQVPQNWPELYEEAVYHDELTDGEPRFRLNVVLDSQSQALDQLAALGEVVLTDIFYNGREIKLKTRKAMPAKYLFNMANIVKDSWQQTSISWNEQYNFVSLDYLDADNDYARDSVVIEADSLGIDGRGLNQLQRDARGVTNKNQVARLGNYLLKASNTISESISFTAFIDGIKIEPGDIIDVAHDVPQYGIASGILLGADTDYIILDRNVDLPPGIVYFLVKKYDDTIEEVAANIVLTGSGNTEHIPTGTIIHLDVQSFVGTIPRLYDKYSIGQSSGTAAKPYRVESVIYKYDHEVEITAIEHFDELYDDSISAIEVPDYSYLPNPNALPALVTNMQISSEASYYPIVRISYTRPPVTNAFGLWDHVEIYVSDDGGDNFQYYGKDSNGSAEISGLAPAVEYTFRLISVSATGRKSSGFVQGSIIPAPGVPPIVHGIELDEFGSGVESFSTGFFFKWRPVSTVPLASQFANNEAYGAGTGNVPEYITGYVVRLYPFYFGYNTSNEFVRREEFVTVPQFDYTFDMNVLDPITPSDYVGIPITAPERYIEIAVWAKDIFGQLSPRPAVFQAYNYPPQLPDLPNVVPVQEFFTQRPIVKKFAARYYWTTPGISQFFSLEYNYLVPFQTAIVNANWPASPDESNADFVGYEIRLVYAGGDVKRFRQIQREFQFMEITAIGTPQIEQIEIIYLDSYSDKISTSVTVIIVGQAP